jgi:hypothetical protein
VGYEARSIGVDVRVAGRGLSVGEEALWKDVMQILLEACHRHIEKTALLFDLLNALTGLGVVLS